jgi:hypothetical protein
MAWKVNREKSGVQSKMKKSSHPVPRPPGSALDAVNQQRQLLRPQTQALALTGHRRKSSTFQPFAVENQAGTIPEKDLEPMARFVDKDKQKSRRRLLLQCLLNQNGQTIEALASIDGTERQKNPRGRR